ncbi:MAG: hypothetical protein Q7O66_16415, partial [Dehalococcoidia bacterium]|nr:hypothetical protein [Dehalococcoidia bacterium]
STPIKKGEQVGVYIEDCREIINRILEAMGKAIHRHWSFGEGPLPVIMNAAVDELSTRIFLRRELSTGLPFTALQTLGACYDEIVNSL